MRYCDIRRFGSATLFPSLEEVTQFFEKAGLGPEPFDLDAKYFRTRLQATERNLKAILLDQRVVAGVGNIYADEALFEAKLSPMKRGKDVTSAEARRLRDAMVKVLNRAIDQRGSTIRNYVGGSGLKGGFQKEFCVYGCTGKPCVRCRTPIVRVRLAGARRIIARTASRHELANGSGNHLRVFLSLAGLCRAGTRTHGTHGINRNYRSHESHESRRSTTHQDTTQPNPIGNRPGNGYNNPHLRQPLVWRSGPTKR